LHHICIAFLLLTVIGACPGFSQDKADSQESLDFYLMEAHLGTLAYVSGLVMYGAIVFAMAQPFSDFINSPLYKTGSTIGGLCIMFGPWYSYGGYESLCQSAARLEPGLDFPSLIPATVTLYGGAALMTVGGGLLFIGLLSGAIEFFNALAGSDPNPFQFAETMLVAGSITAGVGFLSTGFASFYCWLSAEGVHAKLIIRPTPGMLSP
jgi:hypothetical protein